MLIEFNDLTAIQKEAYNICIEGKQPVTRIGGYAGSGKTTVEVVCAQALKSDCVVLAPTNKAAQVLRDKGVSQAQTIHSCLYQPHEVEIYELDANGEPVKVKCPETGLMTPKVIRHEVVFSMSDKSAYLPDLALVDEASMVDQNVYDDLVATFDRVVFFGDPFQLAPVATRQGALDNGKLDIEMKEVHRVALENPITKYATLIREGKEPRLTGVYPEVQPWSINDPLLYRKIVEGEYTAICYTNNMRRHINNKIRDELGYERHTLKDGEPVICLQNVRVMKRSKDPFEDAEKVLIAYNGQVSHFNDNFRDNGGVTSFEMGDLDCVPEHVYAHRIPVLPFWNKDFWQEWEALTRQKARSKIKGNLFDYGYCLTAHKAQGSEFDNVVVFDERPNLTKVSPEDKQRWYYTAVTRAKKQLRVVKF